MHFALAPTGSMLRETSAIICTSLYFCDVLLLCATIAVLVVCTIILRMRCCCCDLDFYYIPMSP